MAIVKIEYEVGDVVKNHLEELGVVESVNTKSLDWFPIKVRLFKVSLNQLDEVLEHKPEQLTLIGSLEDKHSEMDTTLENLRSMYSELPPWEKNLVESELIRMMMND